MADELSFFLMYKNSLYLLIGTICSIFSIGKLNIPITIYIWPFCFLHYLHMNENKIKSLIKIYICILISNLIRWIGCSNLNIYYDLLCGFYFSISTIIPYIIDIILWKKNIQMEKYIYLSFINWIYRIYFIFLLLFK